MQLIAAQVFRSSLIRRAAKKPSKTLHRSEVSSLRCRAEATDSHVINHPLPQTRAILLPLLARGSALRFLLTRLYDKLHHDDGALVRPKDPLEFLARLRFHQQVSGPGAYGLDEALAGA